MVLAGASGSPAHAGVLSEDEFEGTSTELGVIARSFSFVLAGDILAPPFNLVDANPASIGLLDLRLYFIKKTANWKFVVHNQLTAATRSSASLGALSLGRGLEPARLLPLRATAVDDPTQLLRSDVDWLYASYTRGRATITVGRQPITFGRGAVWRPLDLISTFSLTEVDTEYKPGADAVRVDVSLGEKSSVVLIASTGEFEADRDLEASLGASVFVLRGKRSWDRGEAGALLGMVRGDLVAGVDAVYDAGGFDVYAESSLTISTSRSLSSPLRDEGEPVVKAVLGATYKASSKVTLVPELMFNGFGAWNPDDYLAVAASERVAIGEQITWGMLYTNLFATWQAHPLLTVSGGALVNPRDPSALGTLVLNYSFADSVIGVLGGYVPVGKQPTVAGGFAARSEYGVYPYFLFMELKAIL